MRLLSWLLGKKTENAAATSEDTRANAKGKPSGDVAGQTVTPPHPEELGKQAPANPEADKVRRWKESGQAWAWVEKRQGCWNHDEWLAFLEEVKRSPFWPMNADAVGMVLEEIKREWPKRN